MSWAVRGSTRWTSVFIRLSGLLASAAAMGTALSPPAGASGSLVAATGVHGWLAQKRQSPQREIDAYARHMSAGVLHMNEEQYAAAISEFTAALELRPGDIEAAFMLAGAQIAAGDLRQAGKIYERLDSSHPESPVGPFGLGQLHFLVGRMDAAETSLREALSRNSGYLRAWYYLGQVLEAGGRRAEAKQAYQEMLDRFPQARLAALALAKLQLEDNQAAAAAEALEPLESLRPPDPEVLTLLGVAQARSGRQEEASRTLQRVVEVDSGRVEAFYNLGLLELRAGRWRQAEENLRRGLAADPSEVDTRLLLAEVLQGLGRRDEAESLLVEGVAQQPQQRRLRMALGGLLANITGRTAEAADIFSSLVEEDADDEAALRALAEVRVSTGEVAAAGEIYEKLAGRHPEDADLAYQVGYVRRRLGQAGAAREALQRSLALAPDHRDALYEMAMLDLEEEKYAAAEIGFRRVIAADAHRTPAYLNLGKALRGLAKTEEAARVLARFKELEAFDAEVAELRSAARRNPDKAGVYLRLGRLYLQGGRRQQAREMLEKALRIDPDLDAARQQLAKLQRQGSASGPSR